MEKIVRNTTGSDIFVDGTGVNIEAGTSYTINRINYNYWSDASVNDTTFISDVNSGDLVVNNGSIDLDATDGLRYLELISPILVEQNSGLGVQATEKITLEGDVITTESTEGEINFEIGTTPNFTTYSLFFEEVGSAASEWLETNGDGVNSNQAPHIIPFDSKLVALTFTNTDNDSDTDLEIYSVPEGSGSGPSTLKFTWSLTNTRTARKSNFPSDITFSAGDKVAVFTNDIGVNPDNVRIAMYLQITNFEESENSEQWSGNIST